MKGGKFGVPPENKIPTNRGKEGFKMNKIWFGVFILIGFMALGWGIYTKPEPPSFSGTTIVASEGDTLWNYATTYYPGHDPRKVIWEIHNANDIGSYIFPGQQINLPPLESGKKEARK
jgi:hypothetical protein